MSSSALDLTLASATQTMTIAVTSPGCKGAPGLRCFCDTCNNANAETCSSNTDCPPSGGNPGICGGLRCSGGANDGGPCGLPGGAATQCPGGSCGRPGEPSRPNSCIDGYDMYQCVDEAPLGDSSGGCYEPGGYVTLIGTCSNHPQRPCSTDFECDSVPGACFIRPRPCFLDEGMVGGTIVAAGAPDAPVVDVSHPGLLSRAVAIGSRECRARSSGTGSDADEGDDGRAPLTVARGYC